MTNLLTLISALIMVESSGNDNAVGYTGNCYGCLQLKTIYIKDVNRIAGTSYTITEAFDRAKSIDMFRIYINHYATSKRLGHEPTFEDIARIHNGGPNGWLDPRTDGYWKKVKKELKRRGWNG
jgi:hypothetical protein